MCISLVSDQVPTTVLTRAARCAFLGMSDLYVQKLIYHLGLLRGVPLKDRPKTTTERVVLLIKHILPKLSP